MPAVSPRQTPASAKVIAFAPAPTDPRRETLSAGVCLLREAIADSLQLLSLVAQIGPMGALRRFEGSMVT